MSRPPDHIAYWLPTRAAGHRPRIPGVGAGLAALERFLHEAVAAAPTVEVRLDSHAAAPWADEAATQRARVALVDRLGDPDATHVHDLAPAGALPVPQTRWVWHRSADALPALRALLASEAWPRDGDGPVPLTWTRSFRWREPDAAAPLLDPVLADAVPASSATVRIARHVAVRPVLHFPFTDAAPAFDGFAPWLAARLPFVLQPRHFLALSTAPDGRVRTYRLRLPPSFVVAR